MNVFKKRAVLIFLRPSVRYINVLNYRVIYMYIINKIAVLAYICVA
jgi:hypothetical protein